MLSLQRSKGFPKRFGSKRGHGIQYEWHYRRIYPLSENDVQALSEFLGRQIQEKRSSYRWFFASVLVKALGGLYQVRVGIFDGSETTEWEHQWISTSVQKSIKGFQATFKQLLNDDIEFRLAGRPAWILRIRLVFIKHTPRKGNRKGGK
jgi:hypothetical protein